MPAEDQGLPRNHDPSSSEPDLLIHGGTVLTLEPGAEPIANGFVTVKNGCVDRVGQKDEVREKLRAKTLVDARGGLIMPGLVNTHVHGAMTLLRGLADDLPLMTWLMDHMFPAEAAHMNPETVYWGSRLAAAEMMLSGTTTFADSYFHQTKASLAFSQAGLRTVAAQGIIDFPAPGVPDPSRNIDAARNFISEWLDRSPLVRPSVFCHSPYTCSAETLVKGKELASEFGLLYQIHVSETRDEVERLLSEKGMSPALYLDSLGVLDASTLAVHCVHLTQAEIEVLAQRDTPVSICLASEMKLASGLPPLAEMLNQGLTVTLGTDGPASNNNLNMFGEMSALARMYKARTQDPAFLPARQVLDMTGILGARALGWQEHIGRLLPGWKADIIVLDIKTPGLTPIYRPKSHLVYAATGREVRTVIVDGRLVVQDRRILTFDLDETLARVRELARKVV